MSDTTQKGSLIGQGRTAEIFEWGGEHILKLYRNFMPESVCRQEFEWALRVNEHVKVAPEPIEMIHIDGRFGAVYERLHGETMLALLLENKQSLNQYAKMLAKYHADLHRIVDIEGVTVKDKLSEEIRRAPAISPEEKNEVLNHLKALPEGKSICHFDFHPDNIMVADGCCRVMDWVTACIGDPNADVARTRLLLIYAEPPDGHPSSGVAERIFRRLLWIAYSGEYRKLTGAKSADIRRWETPVEAARLCEGVPETEKRKVYARLKKQLHRSNP